MKCNGHVFLYKMRDIGLCFSLAQYIMIIISNWYKTIHKTSEGDISMKLYGRLSLSIIIFSTKN